MSSQSSRADGEPEFTSVGERKAIHDRRVSAVGGLCKDLPSYVRRPPIEAVVFGWGVAEDGQLGLDTDKDVTTPKVVEALLGTRFHGRYFTSTPLVAGSRNTLAIDSEGQILSWGWNARGTLGHGHREEERKPRRITCLRGIRIAQVALGGWHCLAVDCKGEAYAWGGNEYGQCGVRLEERDLTQPVRCVPDLTVAQVSAGGMHSCILTDTGEVWTWGEPWGDFSMKVNREVQKVAGAQDIAKIACGAFHNLALDTAGRVLAWGINDFGQLGNGSTLYETSPMPVQGLEGIPISDIAAGGWHSVALTTEGEVYTWGRGEYGRLGLGDRTGSSKLRATHVKSMEGLRVVQASCGGTHTLVLTAEGRIYTWGRGSFGRLGTGLDKDCFSPVEVFLPGGPERWRVLSVSSGGRHSLALALPDNGEDETRLTLHPSLPNFEDEEGLSELEGTSEEEVGDDLDDGKDHEDDEELAEELANHTSGTREGVLSTMVGLVSAMERAASSHGSPRFGETDRKASHESTRRGVVEGPGGMERHASHLSFRDVLTKEDIIDLPDPD